MKLLAAILVFLLAAPPVQGGFCGMGSVGGTDAAVDAGSHGSMHHGADAGADHGSGGGGHSCCATGTDGDASDRGGNCADMPCGSCSLGVQALLLTAPLAAPLPGSRQAVLTEGRLCPSHASPPYRPPTLIS